MLHFETVGQRYRVQHARRYQLHRITGIWSSIPFLGFKIIHLVDMTDLFKISNLV